MPGYEATRNGDPVGNIKLNYVYAGTWANKPSATLYPTGTRIYISDIGMGGSDWVSDGTRWKPLNGRVVLARGATQSSVTGTTAETALATVTVPAGAMGLNGQLAITALFSYTSSANAKTPRVRFGGAAGAAFFSTSRTTDALYQQMVMIGNRNSASSQIGGSQGASAFGASTGSLMTSSIDTTTDQTVVFSGLLANSSETITLERYSVELIG